ncbi:uncharacterized protein RBU33_005505 isoform 2-T2 [Hipposideros larvatus]
MTDRQEKHHSYSLCSNASQLLTVQSDLEEVPGKKRKTPKYPLDLAVRLHVVASHGLSAQCCSWSHRCLSGFCFLPALQLAAGCSHVTVSLRRGCEQK